MECNFSKILRRIIWWSRSTSKWPFLLFRINHSSRWWDRGRCSSSKRDGLEKCLRNFMWSL